MYMYEYPPGGQSLTQAEIYRVRASGGGLSVQGDSYSLAGSEWSGYPEYQYLEYLEYNQSEVALYPTTAHTPAVNQQPEGQPVIATKKERYPGREEREKKFVGEVKESVLVGPAFLSFWVFRYLILPNIFGRMHKYSSESDAYQDRALNRRNPKAEHWGDKMWPRNWSSSKYPHDGRIYLAALLMAATTIIQLTLYAGLSYAVIVQFLEYQKSPGKTNIGLPKSIKQDELDALPDFIAKASSPLTTHVLARTTSMK